MTIDFRIGQASILYEPQYREIGITVEEVYADTGIANEKKPSNCFGFSYGGWAQFVDKVDGHAFFDPLIEQHPGEVVLLPEDLTALDALLARYKQAHPEAKASFFTTEEDAYLAYLTRFHFWIRWALKRYTMPILQNH